jgi:hypothetical protein
MRSTRQAAALSSEMGMVPDELGVLVFSGVIVGVRLRAGHAGRSVVRRSATLWNRASWASRPDGRMSG